MIARWDRCVDCGRSFGLTRRQSNPGLVAARRRCGPCRTARRRAMTANRTARWRSRRCDAGSAPIYAPAGFERLREELSGV